MKKLNRIFSGILLCAVSALIFASGMPVSGEYRFREFRDDRSRFERYREEADKRSTEDEWRSMLESGRQEMRASWERIADEEMRRYILEGGDEGEIRGSLEEARARWERDFDAELSMSKGGWFLIRERLTSPYADFTGLKERAAAAGSDSTIDTADKWDVYMSPGLAALNSAWSSELNSLIEDVRSKGSALTGREREGFERELGAFEKKIRAEFELERNSVLYLARNLFLSELYTDTDSLRMKSEAESAEAITKNVIQGVESDIRSEEEKILNRSFSGGGSEPVNFSNPGENWQEELKRLIESGMEKWNSARERLYNEMISWRNSAREAFDNIEAKWRLGLEKLEAARSEWERRLRVEIYSGLEEWFRSGEELQGNIDAARSDLDSYMENLSGQWRDHSSGLVEMAVNGSKVYSEALDNIRWLEEMCARSEYRDRGAFGMKGELKKSSEQFASILSEDEKKRIEERISSLHDRGDIPQLYGVSYSAHKTGKMYYQRCTTVEHTTTCRSNELNRLLGHHYYTGGFYSYEYAGSEEFKDENGQWALREIYTVKVFGNRVTYTATPASGSYNSDYRNYGWTESDALVESFTITNEVKSDYVNSAGGVVKGSEDSEKSTYFYYKTELERWKNIRDSFSGIARDAEFYMHERNMLGQDGGAGYLTKEDGSAGDPYLMTGAELNYELALRDREFWERRLDIAKAVLDYAYPADGKRESASETEERKASAESAMRAAKGAYEEALSGVKTITDELKRIQGSGPGTDGYAESIESLSRLYTAAGEKLARAAEELESRRRALIILENGRDSAYIAREIQEIEQNILSRDLQLREIRGEYYTLLKQNESIASAAAFAEAYSGAARGMEDAKLKLALVTGEATDENLILWSGNIAGGKTLVWGESEDAYRNASLLSDLAARFRESEGDERVRYRGELSLLINNLYNSFLEEYAVSEGIFDKLNDRSFDPGVYRGPGTSESGVYAEYAGLSVNALKIIREGFRHVESSGSEKSSSSLLSYLQGLMDDRIFIYGGDNSSYAELYAALNIIQQRYRGLTPEAWEGSLSRLDYDIETAEGVRVLHQNRGGFDITACESDAALGDLRAITLMREYYTPGIAMEGFASLEEVLGLVRISGVREGNIRAFAEQNYSIFHTVQKKLSETDYLSGLLGFINSRAPFISAVGEDVKLTAENLKGLSPRQMSIAAECAMEYVESFDRSGEPLPSYIRRMAEELSAMKSGLDASLLISDYMRGAIEGTPEEIYGGAKSEYDVRQGAAEFITFAGELIESGEFHISEAARRISAVYSSLSAEVKGYLREHDDESVNKIASVAEGITAGMEGAEEAQLLHIYVAEGGGIHPADYADLRGIAGEARERLVLKLLPVYNKARYDAWLAGGGTGGVNAFIAAAGLTGGDAESVKSYALVKSFAAVRNGDYELADPALSGYAERRRLQDCIALNPVQDGEEREEYIHRVVSSFTVSAGGSAAELKSYMTKFLEGDLTAESALPGDVKKFAAMDYYYRSVHLAGGTLHGDSIEELLEERFGRETLDSSITDAVSIYAAGLRASLLYCGQGFDDYLEIIGPEAGGIFIAGYYAGEGALLPMAETGIYGLRHASLALCDIAGGELYRSLESLESAISGGWNSVERDLRGSEEALLSASALLRFAESGAGGNSWRDLILPGNIEVKDSEGNVTGTLVTHIPLDEGGSWYDEINSETGERTGLKFHAGVLEKGDMKYSLSTVIENANRTCDVFSAFLAGAAGGGEPVISAEQFLDDAAGIYVKGNSYSRDGAGLYSYESAMIDRVSARTVLASEYAGRIDDARSSISGLESSINGLTESLKITRESYNLMGGDKGELLKLYENARTAHEAVKSEYEKAGSDLKTRQDEYSAKNREYVDQMSRVSALYGTYRESEFLYEKAYQVWEYANTPYLKGDSVSDSGIGSGETVTGGAGSYGGLPLPDALDAYKRAEARFAISDAEFKKREGELRNQETVEDLNSDAEYLRLKNRFAEMSGTFIRTAQVDAQLNEKIAEYENSYNNALGLYNLTKGGFNIFADMLAEVEKNEELSGEEKEERKSELETVRDTILSRINTDQDRENFINGIAWYSCKMTWERYYNEWKVLADMEPGTGVVIPYNADKKYKYRKRYADMYDALPSQIKSDIELLYSRFGSGNTLTKMLTWYDNYVYAKHMEDYCDDKKEDCKKWEIFEKKKWKKRRNNYRDDKRSYLAKFETEYNSAKSSSENFLKNRRALAEAEGVYRSAVSVRYLSDIKEYLGGAAEKYLLTEDDLGYLYDAMSEGYTPGPESLNIELLREEEQRMDFDGAAVKAKIVEGRVVLLAKDGTELKLRDKNGNVLKDAAGNPLTESYAAGDRSVILKDSGGNSVTEYIEGETYDFYDNNYNISTVAGALKKQSDAARTACYADLMNYVKRTAADGTHDYTVVLRDLEETYHNLQQTAVDFNSANEYRQRGFEGYGRVTSEYVSNGSDTSIQGLIVEELMRQNRAFQEQQWSAQVEKFDLRRERWEEVTGYILNRGNRDWSIKLNEYNTEWKNWRFDARKELEAGDKWWFDREADMKTEMGRWGDETSKASSKAAAEKIYEELAGRIESYEKSVRKNMPGIGFDIDTEKILNNAMRSLPAESIEVLSKSMLSTDTTAGFAQMLNLGLSANLSRYNEQKMDEYRSAVSVMKNLQVIDILNGIIENFNRQLEDANRNVYNAVESGIAKNDTFSIAPFVRKKDEHKWEIRVCVESNLTGDKFKTRGFTDYNYFINSTVFLQPVKGLGGTAIDFTNANTYANIDSAELEVYVGLEQDELNNRIEEVFKEGGLFSANQEEEFDRLGKKFGKYYGEWMAGEALQDKGFYAKPMFPNGPNMLQTAAIAASLTGQPWAAILVAAATSGIQMADGTMTWEQAAFSVGVTAATAAIGVGAEKLANFAAAGSTLTNAAVKATTVSLGNTLVSGVTLEGGSLGWDGDRMTKMSTWTSAGVNAVTSTLVQGYCSSGISKAAVSGLGSGISGGLTTGNWKESMVNGMRNSAAGYLSGQLGGVLGQTTGLGGSAVDNFLNYSMRKMLGSKEEFSWDMIAQNNAVGDMMSKYMSEFFMSPEQLAASREKEKADAEKRKRDFDSLDFMERLDRAVEGMYLSMKSDMLGTVKDMKHLSDDVVKGLDYAAKTMGDLAESVKNKVKYGEFGTDDDPEVRYAKLSTQMVSAGVNLKGLDPRAVIGQHVTGNDGTVYKVTKSGMVEVGKVAAFGDRSEGSTAGERSGETVESKFKQGTSLDKYVKRIAGAYGMEDPADVMNRLLELNDCSEAELRSRMASGKPIIEDASMKWNSNVQAKYDKEAAAKMAAQNQSINNKSNNFDLDYNTAGPNWGGDFSIINSIKSFFGSDNIQQDFSFAKKNGVEIPFSADAKEIDDWTLSRRSFGNQFHPLEETWKFHDGQDFAAREDLPVYALNNGKLSMDYHTNYGNRATIIDNNNNGDFYAHFSKFNSNLKNGQNIKRGDLLGYVGKTGASTGYHLHWGKFVNGKPVDPMK